MSHRRQPPAPKPAEAPPLDVGRLAAARLWASARLPYFATGLFSLQVVPAPGLGTFAVDPSWRLYCDPAVLAEWTVPEAGAVLVHELLHVLRDHAGRAAGLGLGPDRARDWNLAGDAEINDDLLELRLPLPGNPVTPESIGAPNDRLAEEYLGAIANRQRRRASEPDCGSGAHGAPRPWELAPDDPAIPGIEGATVVATRARVALDILEASKVPGVVPASLTRWAASVARPTVDWRRLLAGAVRRSVAEVAGRVDYSFARRSRRAAAMDGVVLPGLVRPVPAVAVVVDTSGSMDARPLADCMAEVDGILAGLGGHQRVTALAVDTEVQATTRVRRGGDVALRGGGGTDMGAGIDHALSLRPRPEVVVVLTDGHTPWPARPAGGVRVVVVLVGADVAGAGPAWATTVRAGAAA
ncbi:MAG: VWA-like domain-containing protein [Actinomycetota bacterium]|nr:VWA-like domain-containing protein [Actinomycetota bacterium]